VRSTVSAAAVPPTASVPPWAARRVRKDWAELCAPTRHPAVFDPAMVAGLPEPVRRYLTHAVAPGTPLWQSVQVSMVGHIKIGAWRPFTATQVVAQPRGYIWAANARLFGIPVMGYDRLSGGSGEMRWRLLDLVPVVSTDGPDMARSAAGRLASEIALIPTAFGGATWISGDRPDTAVASWGPVSRRNASSCTWGRPGSSGTCSCSAGATRTAGRSPGTRSASPWTASAPTPASLCLPTCGPAGGGEPSGRTPASSSGRGSRR